MKRISNATMGHAAHNHQASAIGKPENGDGTMMTSWPTIGGSTDMRRSEGSVDYGRTSASAIYQTQKTRTGHEARAVADVCASPESSPTVRARVLAAVNMFTTAFSAPAPTVA